MNVLKKKIPEFSFMKKYPKDIFYEGNLSLLSQTKISIVGSRKTLKYSRLLTYELASKLAKHNVCVVSGGAMGIDAIAHKGAGVSNTIAVLPCGIDIRYPAVNKNLLNDIQKDGLLLSQFNEGFRATPWSFVVRNELVVALGEVLIVAEAELNSGSLRSIEIAQKMGKEIFVFAHRIGESSATNALLKEGKATAIYDIDEFVSRFAVGEFKEELIDPFKELCRKNPTYDEVLKQFPDKIFQAELSGDIEVLNGRVFLKV
jgi:DNA processing protein